MSDPDVCQVCGSPAQLCKCEVPQPQPTVGSLTTDELIDELRRCHQHLLPTERFDVAAAELRRRIAAKDAEIARLREACEAVLVDDRASHEVILVCQAALRGGA